MDLLLVEDSPTDRLVMHSRVQRAFPSVRVGVVGEAQELTEALRRDNCDVVLTDYWLGWGDGLSVLQRVRRRWPRCKVIFLTGNGGEEVVAEAFKFGLFYYMMKPDGFENLVPVLRMALETKRREDRYELIASVTGSVREAIYSVDSSGTITTWNAAAEHMFDFPAAEIIGQDIEMLAPGNLRAEARRAHERVLRGETINPMKTIRLRRDGARIELDLSMTPVRIDGQAISGVAIVARDASRARSAEIATSISPARARSAAASSVHNR